MEKTIMEYVVALVLALLGGLVFYKKKSEKAETESKLAETKGRDAELEVTQKEAEDAVKAIDDGIEKMKAEREAKRLADENLSLAERAEKMRKDFRK